MKTVILALFTVAALSFNANGNVSNGDLDNVKESKKDRDPSFFLTDALIQDVGKMEHADMMSGNGPDNITTKVCYFVAPGWDHQSCLAQISYHRGDVVETSLVFFTPDIEGLLTADQMGVCPAGDHPCKVCDLSKVEVVNEVIWGTFVDRNDASKTHKYKMGTNFNEMSIWWEE